MAKHTAVAAEQEAAAASRLADVCVEAEAGARASHELRATKAELQVLKSTLDDTLGSLLLARPLDTPLATRA